MTDTWLTALITALSLVLTILVGLSATAFGLHVVGRMDTQSPQSRRTEEP